MLQRPCSHLIFRVSGKPLPILAQLPSFCCQVLSQPLWLRPLFGALSCLGAEAWGIATSSWCHPSAIPVSEHTKLFTISPPPSAPPAMVLASPRENITCFLKSGIWGSFLTPFVFLLPGVSPTVASSPSHNISQNHSILNLHCHHLSWCHNLKYVSLPNWSFWLS